MKIVALMTSYGFMRVEVHDVEQPPKEGEDKPTIKKVRRRVFYWEDNGTIRGKDRTCTLTPFTINMTLQQMRLAIAGKMVRGKDGRIVRKGTPEPAKKAAPKAPEKVSVQSSPVVESNGGQGDGKDATNGVESSSDTLVDGSAASPQPEPKEDVKEVELDAVEA